jgi:hypothetical protein
MHPTSSTCRGVILLSSSIFYSPSEHLLKGGRNDTSEK